jgi:hypothetical protein
MCGHEEDGAGVPEGLATCDICGRSDDHHHPEEYDGRDGSLEISATDEAAMIEEQDHLIRPTQSWDVDDIYFKRNGFKRDQRGFLQPYLINVSINLRVVVDVNAWWAEYGHVESPREIRETIKSGAYDAVKTAAFGHLTHVLRVEEV